MIRRERLGVGHIERRTDAAAPHVVDEGVSVDERSAADVDDEGSIGQADRKASSTMWRVSSPPGSVSMTISADPSRSGSSATACTGIPSSIRGAARNSGELDLEGCQPRRDGLADAAESHEQHATVGEARCEDRRPTALRLGADELRAAAAATRA